MSVAEVLYQAEVL